VRDFLDLSDFLTAVDLLMDEQAVTGIFHVASGEGHSIREVYDTVRAHFGLAPDPEVKVVPPAPDDVPTVVPDPSRTRDLLGWQAHTQFGDTIGRMLQWYDRYGVTDVYSHLAVPKP
jgi:nucleoside-diphosphate-sugar epimerase